MLLIGLTGNIGSGKSTVAQMLSERGATIIDADVLARRAVELGTAGLRPDRRALGLGRPCAPTAISIAPRFVASCSPTTNSSRNLTRSSTPRSSACARASSSRRASAATASVVCDIPLLFERHMTDRFDRIILVDAHRALRLERLVNDRGLEETEAMDMIAAQMPAELKRARADFVIDNDGTLTQLERRVQDVWTALIERGSRSRATAAAVP